MVNIEYPVIEKYEMSQMTILLGPIVQVVAWALIWGKFESLIFMSAG